MKQLFILFLALALASLTFADGPWVAMEKEEFIKKALNSVQQEGDFYFIPFPKPEIAFSDHQSRVKVAQIFLWLLDGFKKKNPQLSVVSFTIERDQHTYLGAAKTYGMFVHAVLKKK